ncbi:MAG: DUF4296 domain-containing protein [Muribaculaceae bacterium]|nr:DUF4296 domain-containing protein [Muribaculaceae bacterium]
MRKIGLTIAVVTAIMAFGGCHRTPEGIIPPHKMADLIIDIHKAEGVVDMDYRDWGNDSSKLLLRDAVYRRHNADQAKVDSSLAYYGRNITDYIKIYDEVISRLEEDIDKSEAMGNQGIQLSIVGDSANAWPLARRIILNSISPSKVISFALQRDENWQNGDSYTWNAKVINARDGIKWLIGAEYADGSLEWNTAESGEGNDAVSIWLQTDSTRDLEKVFGYAVTAPVGNDILYLDSISLVRERVNKRNYSRRSKQQRVTPLPADSVVEKKK